MALKEVWKTESNPFALQGTRRLRVQTSEEKYSRTAQKSLYYEMKRDGLPCRLKYSGVPQEEVKIQKYHASQTGSGRWTWTRPAIIARASFTWGNRRVDELRWLDEDVTAERQQDNHYSDNMGNGGSAPVFPFTDRFPAGWRWELTMEVVVEQICGSMREPQPYTSCVAKGICVVELCSWIFLGADNRC